MEPSPTKDDAIVADLQRNVTTGQENDNSNSSENGNGGGGGCCSCVNYDGINEAKGYGILGVCRGPVYMSNVFLSTALLYLASKEAGCLIRSDDGNNDDDELEIDDECSGRVYGFTPASLITNIAVISGLLSALFMPLIGAILDFTTHRKMVGIISVSILATVQLIQIGTGESTWFIMAILQAIVGFVFQVQLLVAYSYLPDVARVVEEAVMVKFSGNFTLMNYSAQLLFLIVVTGISIAGDLTTVMTARVSQGVLGILLFSSDACMHGLDSLKRILNPFISFRRDNH